MSSLVAPAVGIALVLLGLAFLRRHGRTWADRRDDPALPADERDYYGRQYRRRRLTSGVIVALGVLIPVGDLLLNRRFPAATVLAYWAGVFCLVLILLLLGLVDFFATGLHTKDALLRVRGEKAALQRQIEEVRRSLREAREQEPPEPPRLTPDRLLDRGRLGNGIHREPGGSPREGIG